MKTRQMKKRMFWVLAGLLGAIGALRAAEPETAYMGGDTIRLSWEVASGEEKSFTFAGTADAVFIVEWGDGVRSRLKGHGEDETVTVRHTYRLGKVYDVCFYGLPEAEEIAWEGFTDTVGGVEFQMVKVVGGTFQMGCTDEQYGQCKAPESPVHAVTLDDYYIGMFEVTQAQWKAVMGPWSLLDTLDICYGCPIPEWAVEGDDYPVFYISWNEATAFCEKLSALTGKTYRLPTEAEWEYAARGGQHTDGTIYSGSNNVEDVAWYRSNSSISTSSGRVSMMHPVGMKKPNGLGLYDMSGNVSEWCYDWYDKDYYSVSPTDNPQGASSGSERVFRGGSWDEGGELCRVSYRYRGAVPRLQHCILGFRVVCEP